MIETLSKSGLADLEAEKFSDAHAKHVEAGAGLGKAAGIRSRIVKDLDSQRKGLRDARRLAIEAAIAGTGFEEASARVASLQEELGLLDTALRHYNAYAFADAQRATLAAKVEMYDRQYQSERARLSHKVAEIEIGVSAVAMNNHGHIEIQMGSVTRPYEELIARLGRSQEEAMNALKNHDAETRALRDEVGEL